ncbi:MAG: S41 family peptidase [Bdellovibrionales bacterium]|nr:S41 family peptidase [Bdellovibrionales bacterium]
MKTKYLFLFVLFIVQLSGATETQPHTIQKLETFSKVLGYLEQNYIDSINPEKLVEQAIKGMVSELDPHTTYLTKDEYEQMRVDTSGKFGGIGIELGMNENKELIVIKPMETGPAIHKGVKEGDRILEVNGESTKGWSIIDAVQKLRGPNGSTVKLKLIHETETESFDVELRRTTIYIKSVSHKVLLNEYGYIQVKSFQENTDRDVENAFYKLKKDIEQKKRTMKGLILDLRNNPGGLLDQAVKVTDLFVDHGIIVSTKGRSGTQVDVSYAKKEGTLPELPMVTLINDGTASASEIVAGALQDHLRSTLIGTPSFGKGSVQTIIDLEDGSGLKMTVARYYTPSDRPIQNMGNQPDLYVSYFNYRPEDEYFRRESDLEGSIDTVEIDNKSHKRKGTGTEKILDPQLKASLEYLKTVDRMGSSKKSTNEKK